MFELTEPTKAKLQKTDDKAIKVGQKDHKPAAILNLSVVLPNSALAMFDPALRPVLYGPGNPTPAAKGKTVQLEGMDMVKDLPALTKTGQWLSSIAWGEEQTGCTLTVDYGLGDEKANIVLRDGTTKDFKIALHEGGAIKVGFRFHAPVDALSVSQIGQLHLMHQRDVTVTLSGPRVQQQAAIDEQDDASGDGTDNNPMTPLAALKQGEAAARAGGDGKPKVKRT